MLLDESTSVVPRAHRDLALARLDSEFRRYEAERRRPEVYAKLEEPPPLGGVEAEARHLVTDRYGTSHHGVVCDQDDCDHPVCQRDVCDSCHRVLALMYLSAFCGNREEYKPIMRWILDPEFLA